MRFSWLFVGALAVLSACLSLMQYRWIGEVSRAERERLHSGLQSSLRRLSQDFNWELASACAALIPDRLISDGGQAAIERQYVSRSLQSRDSGRHSRIIRSVLLAVPENGSLALKRLDPEKGEFRSEQWPVEWTPVREALAAHISADQPRGRGLPPVAERYPDLIELPQFAGSTRGGSRFPRETEWLLVQLDLDYIRAVVLPELLQRDLGSGSTGDYQTEITMASDSSMVIYRSGPPIGKKADASVRLFEVRPDFLFRRQEGHSNGRRGPQEAVSDRGRWLLAARHRAGSLEAVVQRARWRNLAVTTGLLLLLMAAMAALVRFTRRAQQLAELQMEFVAGVSHELRTPLSVMRTAGHNLRGRVAGDPNRVQRYGELIEQESEKLTAIVEQVLQFSNAKAGRVIGTPEPVSVATLIDEALRADRKLIDDSGCVLEQNIQPELPPVLADATALRHVVQNLLSNAVKYGKAGRWIGISASMQPGNSGSPVEIRVADHGPGIPPDELRHVFDPFYRGRKPTQDQIHGTGLGLSLAKRIVEAHRGDITARSEPGKITEFIMHLPAAPVEQPHELSNPVS